MCPATSPSPRPVCFYINILFFPLYMEYRTGILYNQKHAVWFKRSISLTYPLCPQLDSALRILSGCQHKQIRNMITERHNLACSIIFKAISKTGSLGSSFVCMNIGSSERQPLADPPCPYSTDLKISAFYNVTFTSLRSSTVRTLYRRTS